MSNYVANLKEAVTDARNEYKNGEVRLAVFWSRYVLTRNMDHDFTRMYTGLEDFGYNVYQRAGIWYVNLSKEGATS